MFADQTIFFQKTDEIPLNLTGLTDMVSYICRLMRNPKVIIIACEDVSVLNSVDLKMLRDFYLKFLIGFERIFADWTNWQPLHWPVCTVSLNLYKIHLSPIQVYNLNISRELCCRGLC